MKTLNCSLLIRRSKSALASLRGSMKSSTSKSRTAGGSAIVGAHGCSTIPTRASGFVSRDASCAEPIIVNETAANEKRFNLSEFFMRFSHQLSDAGMPGSAVAPRAGIGAPLQHRRATGLPLKSDTLVARNRGVRIEATSCQCAACQNTGRRGVCAPLNRNGSTLPRKTRWWCRCEARLALYAIVCYRCAHSS